MPVRRDFPATRKAIGNRKCHTLMVIQPIIGFSTGTAGMFKRVLSSIFWFLTALVSGTTLLLSAAFLYLNPQVPDTESFKNVTIQAPLRIYSADGKLNPGVWRTSDSGRVCGDSKTLYTSSARHRRQTFFSNTAVSMWSL